MTHCTKAGAASGVEFKNVELGVLFHSSPERAYHAPPPPDCDCRSCRRRRCRRGLHLGTRAPSIPPLPPPPPEVTQRGAVSSTPGNVFGQRGLANEVTAVAAAATAAATAPPSVDLVADRDAQGPPSPAGSRPRPRPIPLPVPFCLDSETYADPEGESPHPRFAPFMHTLKNQRPW